MMNAGQHEDNDDADNSDVDVGNSGDNTDNSSVDIAGGDNARERKGQKLQQCCDSHDNDDEINMAIVGHSIEHCTKIAVRAFSPPLR